MTPAVVAGTHRTRALAPRATETTTVRITVGQRTPVGRQAVVRLTARSPEVSARVDAVKATVRAVRR